MALPTTITGISTAVACAGPVISSAGNVYFLGPNGTTTSQLDVQKATDPTSSFSAVANTSDANTVRVVAACQVADVIHIAWAQNALATQVTYFYSAFNMASDSFSVTKETIVSAVDVRTSAAADPTAISIVVRSGGEVVVLFNGNRVANMGTSYAQTYYSRRTAVNTWSAAVQVSAGGTVDFAYPEAILGTSDRIQFHYAQYGAAGVLRERALSSGNVLQTEQSPAGNNGSNLGATTFSAQGQSYNNAGTIKVVVGAMDSSQNPCSWTYDSADTPTITKHTVESANILTAVPTVDIFVDGTDVWALYAKNADSDLYVAKSTDNGATFAASSNAFTCTAQGLSIDGNIFTRGSSVVIPYVVNDGGTLKYNEYVVRTITAAFTAKSYISSQAVNRASTW